MKYRRLKLKKQKLPEIDWIGTINYLEKEVENLKDRIRLASLVAALMLFDIITLGNLR